MDTMDYTAVFHGLLDSTSLGYIAFCYCCCCRHCCGCSGAKSYPNLCEPMKCSMPGFSVPHHLPEFTQIRVHWIGDAIQLSHPLMPSSPSAINLSQHEGLSQWVIWPKYWSFSISPSSEHPGLISFRMDWLDLLAVQGTLKSLILTYQFFCTQLSALNSHILSHHFMANRWGISVNSDGFYFLGLQNDCRLWPQPWN